jgi:hypothetical protein
MLKEIMAISGYPGLFKLVSQAKNGIIVESLEDGKRMPAYATYKVNALEDIAVFTESEDIKLADVFRRIFEKTEGKEAVQSKSADDVLKKFFAEVLPEYDKKQVYVSDIRKIIAWYNILVKKDLLKFEEEKAAPEAETQSAAAEQ